MEFLPLRIDDRKVYAGFWKRAAAAIIDLAIALPIYYLIMSSRKYGYNLAVMDSVLCGGLFVAYDIYFNGQYGGSLGKLAMGIRVTIPDGGRISWPEAWKRSSVDTLFAIVFICMFLVPLLEGGSQHYSAMGIDEREKYLTSYYPSWYFVVDLLSIAWSCSELFVLLLNRRKRALHDFIAGTVVINNKFMKRSAVVDWEGTDLFPGGTE